MSEESKKTYVKDIKSDNLIIGKAVIVDYYSYKGDLLIKNGTVIESTHIDALKSRFYDDLYILFEEDSSAELSEEDISENDAFEDLEVLEQAYKTDLEAGEVNRDPINDKELSIDELQEEFIDEDFQEEDFESSEINFEDKVNNSNTINITNKEFDYVSFGSSGLEQLLESTESRMIDSYVSRTESYSNPVGYAQKNKLIQIGKEDRTREYKNKIQDSYSNALKKVKELLISVASGSGKIDVFYIKRIVSEIIDVFNRDRSIMVNMANANYKESDYLFKHALNIAILSINISLSYGYSLNQIIDIAMGAILADVGMLLISPEILNKQGHLDKEELAEIYKHPIIGSQIIAKINKIPPVVQFVAYQHHEKINGLGYPHGKKTMHNYAKIVQVADVYDALISKRSHRDAYTPFKAMSILSNMVSIKMIEQDLFKAFIEYTSIFPIGSLVRLNDQRIAKVVATNDGEYSKPIVYIVIDENGNLLKDRETYEVDLLENPSISIVSSLKNNEIQKINIMFGF